ncbi:MAG TPA: 6,7-dimethyl-8-ribityllumazine synthase [Spirochaetota bacterium]|nr:6,7-dimethyl-8-ribityllumazine synthase [Spirochaetota bacterium]
MQIEGDLSAAKIKTAIIVSRFNEFITEKLLSGAQNFLLQHGAAADNIDTIFVPGAFEIAIAAKKACSSGRYQAVICLGCIIRGGTPHFDYIAAETAAGIARTALEYTAAVSFGILTVDNIEQAVERAGTKMGNKGREAAAAAVATSNLLQKL